MNSFTGTLGSFAGQVEKWQTRGMTGMTRGSSGSGWIIVNRHRWGFKAPDTWQNGDYRCENGAAGKTIKYSLNLWNILPSADAKSNRYIQKTTNPPTGNHTSKHKHQHQDKNVKWVKGWRWTMSCGERRVCKICFKDKRFEVGFEGLEFRYSLKRKGQKILDRGAWEKSVSADFVSSDEVNAESGAGWMSSTQMDGEKGNWNWVCTWRRR